MASRLSDRKRKAVAIDMSIDTSAGPSYSAVQSPAQSVRRSCLLRGAASRHATSNLTSTTHVVNDPSNTCTSSTTVVVNDPTQMSTPSINLQLPGPAYIDLGDCTNICEYCGALFWFAERLKSSPQKQRLKYNMCCKGGMVRLPFQLDPPVLIRSLYSTPSFMLNIRAYNSMFSMTSFGAHVDDTINETPGPYAFKVAGQVSHWLGSLCPSPGDKPRFLLMYIFDTENEIQNRLRFFNQEDHRQLSPEIVLDISNTLTKTNEYVRLFKTSSDLCLQQDVPNFAITLYNTIKESNYGLPATGTIGAIICDNDPLATDYDIVIHSKDGRPKRVSKLHPSYMPLQYPLLFPCGEQGWSPNLRLASNSRERNLTMNKFYAYQIHDRQGLYSLLLNGGRLLQQYLVDAHVCVEQCRLEYIRTNQDMFRTEFLHGIHDAYSKGDTEGRQVGKRTILPSSFTGGPRYMYRHYQDAIAICRVHGNPQYFITFTCNVRWPEIKRYMDHDSCITAQDSPDIIARVFQIKVELLTKFLKSNKTFRHVAADQYTIEFQKRGLPHCHMLLWVTPECKIRNAEDVDKFISAEIPNPSTDPNLYRIVTELMIHGPCGSAKMKAPCMVEGKCSRSYPKPYEQVTHFDKQGNIHYKRPSDGERINKAGVPLDNSHVIAYNRTLSLHFEAHINVEYCGWNMLIKYLFKYISKGADRVRYAVTKSTDSLAQPDSQSVERVNEITNFVDGRFICPHEAAWRLHPSVQLLAVHLENQQNITFKDNQHLHVILNNPVAAKTTLTKWLKNNQLDPNGKDLHYIDYLSRYRWDNSSKTWLRRQTTRTPAIGRLIYIHPTCGEPFYLRMLLGHQSGCRSFEDIRTVSDVIYPTYRSACEKLCLIGNDTEWATTYTEASKWASSTELRSLFTHMLLFCDISNPLALWKEQ